MDSQLRRLPGVIPPLPDEPFDSWFETMAATLRATAGEMATALGLADNTRVALPVGAWSRQLTEAQVARLEAATGLEGQVFHAATRAGFAAHAVQFDRRGAISTPSGITGATGRFCPECLQDSGGRWRLTWEFVFGFACVRHRRLLADACPKCARRPRRATHPYGLFPRPGHCHNPDPDTPNGHLKRCGGDLRMVTSVEPASEDALTAQRLILQSLSAGHSSAGIWANGPQQTVRVLADFRFLAQLAAHEDSGQRRTSGSLSAAYPSGVPAPTVARQAAQYARAGQALQDPACMRRLLEGRVGPSTSYASLSPQLQILIAEARGVRRRPTAVLQTSRYGADPVVRAAKVPALLWAEWAEVLTPFRRDRANAAGALAAAIVVSGSRLTHAAALRLLDATAPARSVTNVMRQLGRSSAEVDTIAVILRLADYLDRTRTPIDYARRRTLDYSGLLPTDEWERIAIACNVHTGAPRRPVLARAYAHRLVSGDATRRLSHSGVLPPTDAEVDAFARTAPAHVLEALHTLGERFLHRQGIDEPVSWAPELGGLGVDSGGVHPWQAGPGPRATWKARRPARGDDRCQATVQGAHADGASVRDIASTLRLSRQSVARSLADEGVRLQAGPRRRFHIDLVWLDEQRTSAGRTIAELAATIGCSPSTIRRSLSVAGSGTDVRVGVPVHAE